VILALALVPGAAPVKVALAQSHIGVNVTPQQTTVGFNENFTVTIWIDDSLGESYDAIAIRLVYNTNYVTATNVTDAGTFDWVLDSGTINNTWNATHGLIKYDAANIGGSLNTSNPVITVNFTGSSSNTGISGLDFIYIPADTATSVMSWGADILNWTYVVNGTVEVVGPALMVSVSPAGKGDVNINGVIPSAYPNTTRWNSDEVVNLTAVASTPNWMFDHWSGDISGSDNPTNITMDSGKSVVAHFARYSLTVTNTTGGTVTQPGLGTFRYPEAENVTLVATNYIGYHFVSWTGDVGTIDDVDSATTNITMDGDYSIVANFAIDRYDLTISSTSGGNVTTPGEGVSTYDAGTVVDLVAMADSGYHFVNWMGDVGTIDDVDSATTNITMDGDYSIVANFAINRYNLTISSTSGGNVTTPGEGVFTYDAGTVVDLVAMADSDYDFVNWTGDVGTIDDVDSAITNITMSGNYSITSNFAAVPTTTLEGHVTFAERGSNNTKWAESFNITLFEAGNLSNVLWTGNATTNNIGVFTISGLTPGTYDIAIKNWTCLSDLVTNETLTDGNTTVVNFGTTREGDANNDDHITILDASSLASIYGSSEDDPGWNPHCDFDRDGNINMLDASALANNYGQHGDLA